MVQSASESREITPVRAHSKIWFMCELSGRAERRLGLREWKDLVLGSLIAP